MAARALGWLWASCLLVAAASLGALATALIRRWAPHPPQAATTSDLDGKEGEPPRFWATLEALVLRVGGWIALGLLGQSYIESFVPGPHPLAALGLRRPRCCSSSRSPSPASICTAGAVPIAAALVGKGLSPVIAVAGLVLGSGPEQHGQRPASSRRGQAAGVVRDRAARPGRARARPRDWTRCSRQRPQPGRSPGAIVEWAALAFLVSIVRQEHLAGGHSGLARLEPARARTNGESSARARPLRPVGLPMWSEVPNATDSASATSDFGMRHLRAC